mmetsp:Transcript_28068/g.90648  ORF Transcript_28068/g.90648 Transcript_28068/m.90648 type:complete len:706 (-) Transcript_28068:301-2418(-)
MRQQVRHRVDVAIHALEMRDGRAHHLPQLGHIQLAARHGAQNDGLEAVRLVQERLRLRILGARLVAQCHVQPVVRAAQQRAHGRKVAQARLHGLRHAAHRPRQRRQHVYDHVAQLLGKHQERDAAALEHAANALVLWLRMPAAVIIPALSAAAAAAAALLLSRLVSQLLQFGAVGAGQLAAATATAAAATLASLLVAQHAFRVALLQPLQRGEHDVLLAHRVQVRHVERILRRVHLLRHLGSAQVYQRHQPLQPPHVDQPVAQVCRHGHHLAHQHRSHRPQRSHVAGARAGRVRHRLGRQLHRALQHRQEGGCRACRLTQLAHQVHQHVQAVGVQSRRLEEVHQHAIAADGAQDGIDDLLLLGPLRLVQLELARLALAQIGHRSLQRLAQLRVLLRCGRLAHVHVELGGHRAAAHHQAQRLQRRLPEPHRQLRHLADGLLAREPARRPLAQLDARRIRVRQDPRQLAQELLARAVGHREGHARRVGHVDEALVAVIPRLRGRQRLHHLGRHATHAADLVRAPLRQHVQRKQQLRRHRVRRALLHKARHRVLKLLALPEQVRIHAAQRAQEGAHVGQRLLVRLQVALVDGHHERLLQVQRRLLLTRQRAVLQDGLDLVRGQRRLVRRRGRATRTHRHLPAPGRQRGRRRQRRRRRWRATGHRWQTGRRWRRRPVRQRRHARRRRRRRRMGSGLQSDRRAPTHRVQR